MIQHLLRLLACSFLFTSSAAQVIWNGPTITFSKAALADPTQAANQDRLTADTWITRAASEGIYNAATEPDYQRFSSPANTEWATGSLANYATLTYKPWAEWAGGAPNIPGIVGKTAVVHLIKENIYLSITFTAWGVRPSSGGTFAYQRTTAPVVTPVKLMNFLVSQKNNLPNLNWKTASEENTAMFTIERSADGKQFAAIGTVPAAGNSHSEKQYAFIDASPSAVNFYRLRTDDRDGKSSYSAVVAYRYSRQSSLLVFPNPVSRSLYLQRGYSETTPARIVDASGRAVLLQVLPAGSIACTIDVGVLKPGLYFLLVGEERRGFIKN